jgi:hypothetical protein
MRRKARNKVEELNDLLERLENKGFTKVIKKEGAFGMEMAAHATCAVLK